MEKQVPKTLIVGIGVTIIALLIIYLFTSLPQGGERNSATNTQAVNYGGSDKCASCHRRVTPDIVTQFAKSSMAKAGVKCEDCHAVDRNNPMGKDHQGFFITTTPTPKNCAKCHPAETRQFDHSRHGSPAWIALTGLDDFTSEQKKMITQIPEANRGPNGIVTAIRNSLFEIEGPSVTPAACESCHSIGKPNKDGSIGNCNKCHLRHEFSIE